MKNSELTDDELMWLHFAAIRMRDEAFLTTGDKRHNAVLKWEKIADRVNQIAATQRKQQPIEESVK